VYILPPYLFARYIRDLIIDSGVGCKIADQILNILAYADDLVLLAPSWNATQSLVSILHAQATYIDMTINIQKTVAMVFTPSRRSMIVTHTFPPLKIDDHCIRYVEQFKYLGYIVTDSLTDDEDMNREIKNMFVRTNILLRKYKFCSVEVKTILFQSVCLCMYDIELWKVYYKGTLNRFRLVIINV